MRPHARNGHGKADAPVGPADVGTLWTMRRNDLVARCVLFAWRNAWELRVLVGADTLLTERCDRAADAFSLAERWKYRLAHQAWRLVVPRRSSI